MSTIIEAPTSGDPVQKNNHAKLIRRLSTTLQIRDDQVSAAVQLLDEGATVPFIARYRQDRTGGLDDIRLRELSHRLEAERNLIAKREETARLLENMDKLTPALLEALSKADTLKAIEDIYRPFRPKRRTRASDARDAGLQPLADLLRDSICDRRTLLNFIAQLSKNTSADTNDLHAEPDFTEACLKGARDILAEEISDDPAVRASTRRSLMEQGVFSCKIKTRKRAAGDDDEATSAKMALYKQYETFRQPFRQMKGYQVLAINRGEREGYLTPRIEMEPDRAFHLMDRYFQNQKGDKALDSFVARQRDLAIMDSWGRLLRPSLETELRSDLKSMAEIEALSLFSKNLRNTLMAPPLRDHVVLALDPGYRNGCKVAVTDRHGAVLDTAVIFPVKPREDIRNSRRVLDRLVIAHDVDVIALGNGTATRETEQFVRAWLNERSKDLSSQTDSRKRSDMPVVIVNESGASIYSASEAGSEEFPDLPVELRSAISLARRLQDPLAELVKIEPAALGVGQYQHDMDQKQLAVRLDEVVEDCVNQTGADLNVASKSLLSHISGITAGLASNIYQFREENGSFQTRADLLKVPRLGPKAFELCAGFLRVPDGLEPLDNTAVHPESYSATRRLINLLISDPNVAGRAVDALSAGHGLDLKKDADAYGTKRLSVELEIGPSTLRQILDDLSKAGRDGRKDYQFPTRSADISDIDDLKPDMIVQGVVRNVVAFGAFVDIGVHQDGLVHISQLADHFVSDPTTVVHADQVVTVRVLEVDQKKRRISLSMKGLEKKI